MTFIDTNYLLRFLLDDVHPQFLEAKKLLLEAANGKAKLITSTLVFFEIYWVLRSYYQKDNTQTLSHLQKILDMTFIEITERPLLQDSLDLCKQNNLRLPDCFNLVYAKSKGVKNFQTFDQKLSKAFLSF